MKGKAILDRDWLRLGRLGALALAVVFFLASPSWAADGLLSPQYDLGIWSLVVFVLLFLVLRKWAWGPMLQGLQQREAYIHEAQAEAERARDEAKRFHEQFQAKMDQAAQEVRGIIEEGRRATERMQTDMIAKARAEIQTERERLHRELSIARDQALQDLWNQTAQLAALISSKAMRRSIGPDDHRRFVDEAITDLRQAGKERQQQLAS